MILDSKYLDHWMRIKELTGNGAEKLVSIIEKYINVLSESQHDTYTNPFEIVSPNLGKTNRRSQIIQFVLSFIICCLML